MNSLQYLSSQVDRVISHSSANSSPSNSGRSSSIGFMVRSDNPESKLEEVDGVERDQEEDEAEDNEEEEGEDEDEDEGQEEERQRKLSQNTNMHYDKNDNQSKSLFESDDLHSLRSYKSNDTLNVKRQAFPEGLDSTTDEGFGTSGSDFDSSVPSSPLLTGNEYHDLSVAPSSNLLNTDEPFKLSARTIFILLTKLLYLFVPDRRHLINPLSFFRADKGRQPPTNSHDTNSSLEKTSQDTLHTLRKLQSPYGTSHKTGKLQPLTGIANLSSRRLKPPRPLLTKNPIKKTLVLDLDETLIHSLSRGSRFSAGQMVEVKLESQFATLYFVNKRPFCDEFLRSVSQWYKLVVFTASVQAYADPMIDWLEQERKYFSQRLYRQHCTATPNGYIKDLSKIRGDLSKVIIVDNSPISYAMHEENAISVEGWISDPTDRSLQNLVPLLHALHYSCDVRSFLSLKGGDSSFDY